MLVLIMPQAFVEDKMAAILVAPEIPLDSKIIVLNPNNVMHPAIQKYLASKGCSAEITKDRKRIRFKDNSDDDPYNGFKQFLKENVGIDEDDDSQTPDPNALNFEANDSIPEPVDPKIIAQRREIAELRHALENKDWDAQPAQPVEAPPVIATEIVPPAPQEAEKGTDRKSAKFKAGMFTAFTIFKEVASILSIAAVTTAKRTLYNSYLTAINPFFDLAFGKISSEDGYAMDTAQTESRKAAMQPKQSLVVQAPSSTNSNRAPQILFSRSGSSAKNGATTITSFVSRMMMYKQLEAVAAAKANAVRAQENSTPKYRGN